MNSFTKRILKHRLLTLILTALVLTVNILLN